MGAYFKIVNPARREYLNPGDFGEAVKFSGVLQGKYCVNALKYLICDAYARCSKCDLPWDLAGSWVGDPIILTSDDTSPPNPRGFITTTPENPHRNLNYMAAEEFYNISHVAIATLSEYGHAVEIVASAESNDKLFLTIADLLMKIEPPKLTAEFHARFGHAWRKHYDDLFRRCSGHQPLPLRTE